MRRVLKHHGECSQRRSAFTIVELMVTFVIILVLGALLSTVLISSRHAAHAFRCQNVVRNATFEFAIFSDDQLHLSRGDDPTDYFHLETFQESLYGIDEFWQYGNRHEARFNEDALNRPLHCPSVTGELVLQRDASCSEGGVESAGAVSYGFNLRLHARPSNLTTFPTFQRFPLTARIVEASSVPLLWEVDGVEAERRNVSPVFSGPPYAGRGLYTRFWFPDLRHNGSMNVGFIDGHVDSSRNPVGEASWQWFYLP